MALVSVVNGRPVGPDVRKLMERFGSVARGQEISHAEVEAIIGAKHKEDRYRTVTSVWRKQVHETTGVFVEAVHGVGFRGCVASDQLSTGGRAVKSAARKLATGIVLAQTTPVEMLEVHEVKRREHLLTNGASMVQALKSTSGFVLAPPPKV